MVGHVPACVRPWALFPALLATNEQPNNKPSLRSIPWHPDQRIHSTGPARNLSNARENPSSVAWGLRLSVLQLHISIPTTSCVCVCICAHVHGTRNQTQGFMQTFQPSPRNLLLLNISLSSSSLYKPPPVPLPLTAVSMVLISFSRGCVQW